MNTEYFDSLEYHRWDTQVTMILGFSILSSLISVFAPVKYATRYSRAGFTSFIWSNLFLLSSFATMIVSSVYLIKISTVDGTTVQVLPGWATPWLYIITILGIINTFLTVSYCCIVLLSRALASDGSSSETMSEMMFVSSLIHNKYRTKYVCVSFVTIFILISVCLSTFICAIVLCDPGSC